MIHIDFVYFVQIISMKTYFVLCVHDSLDLTILSYCWCEGFDENGKERRQEWTCLSGPLVQCKSWCSDLLMCTVS